MNARERITRQITLLDALSTVVVAAAGCYCWVVLREMPPTLLVSSPWLPHSPVRVDQSAIWRDVGLMAGVYAAFSMIEIFIGRLRIDRPIRRFKPKMATAWFKFCLLIWFAAVIVVHVRAAIKP